MYKEGTVSVGCCVAARIVPICVFVGLWDCVCACVLLCDSVKCCDARSFFFFGGGGGWGAWPTKQTQHHDVFPRFVVDSLGRKNKMFPAFIPNPPVMYRRNYTQQTLSRMTIQRHIAI